MKGYENWTIRFLVTMLVILTVVAVCSCDESDEEETAFNPAMRPEAQTADQDWTPQSNVPKGFESYLHQGDQNDYFVSYPAEWSLQYVDPVSLHIKSRSHYMCDCVIVCNTNVIQDGAGIPVQEVCTPGFAQDRQRYTSLSLEEIEINGIPAMKHVCTYDDTYMNWPYPDARVMRQMTVTFKHTGIPHVCAIT